MNILCLCDHGQTRSVAMATVLREQGHFAVAGAFDNWDEDAIASGEKLTGFGSSNFPRPTYWYECFDLVIEMQEGGEHFIGRDTYGSFDNMELRTKCWELAESLDLLNL